MHSFCGCAFVMLHVLMWCVRRQEFRARWLGQAECKTTARVFESLRAEPNGFRVHLLTCSDTLSRASVPCRVLRCSSTECVQKCRVSTRSGACHGMRCVREQQCEHGDFLQQLLHSDPAIKNSEPRRPAGRDEPGRMRTEGVTSARHPYICGSIPQHNMLQHRGSVEPVMRDKMGLPGTIARAPFSFRKI